MRQEGCLPPRAFPCCWFSPRHPPVSIYQGRNGNAINPHVEQRAYRVFPRKLSCYTFLRVESFKDQLETVETVKGHALSGACATSSIVFGQDIVRFCPFRCRPQAFDLAAGSVVITLPEDRLFDEMEQLVLSTKHLHGLLDDFVLRQPTRRVIKVGVVKAAAAPWL